MDRLLRDTTPKILVDLTNADGDLVDPDPGFENAVVVTITDSAGTQLLTGAATNDPGVGRYSRTLAVAETQTLDTYTARWDATIGGTLQKFYTRFEIVGAYIVQVAEIRVFDPDLNVTDYPTERVIRAREYAEEHMEELLKCSMRPRGTRETLDGSGLRTQLVRELFPTRLVSASIDQGSSFVALTASELADVSLGEEESLTRGERGIWIRGRDNVKVHYEHGLAEAPEPVREATLELIRERLVNPQAIPPRAQSVETEGGTFRLSVAGRDGRAGIPFVDSVVREFAFGRRPAVG